MRLRRSDWVAPLLVVLIAVAAWVAFAIVAG